MKRTAEFDAFGPWIHQVRDPEDVPRLYRAHRIDLGRALLVLKVPRSLWRRDANPDMDLYDHLIVAGRDALTVLSRRGSAFDVVELPYARMSAVQNSVALLDGRFVVRDVVGTGPGGVAINVQYNGVSSDLIDQLVRLVRSAVFAMAPGGFTVMPPHLHESTLALRDLGDADVALVAKLRDLATQNDRESVTIAATRRAPVKRRGGRLHQLRDSMWPMTLQAAIVNTGPGELQCVHRREWITAKGRPTLSVAHTVVFTPHVTSVVVRDDPEYVGAQVVEIVSGRSVVGIAFPDGTDTGAAVKGSLGAMSST